MPGILRHQPVSSMRTGQGIGREAGRSERECMACQMIFIASIDYTLLIYPMLRVSIGFQKVN